MARPLALDELAMEVQAQVAGVEHTAAPMWSAAKRTGRPLLVARVRRLARFLRLSRREAHAIAGMTDAPTEIAA